VAAGIDMTCALRAPEHTSCSNAHKVARVSAHGNPDRIRYTDARIRQLRIFGRPCRRKRAAAPPARAYMHIYIYQEPVINRSGRY